MGRCITVLCLAMAFAAFAPRAKANDWNEATDGDLSGNRLAPSTLALSPGLNTVTGSVLGGTTPDLDYLTITVPDGYRLSGIDLLSFASADDLAFIGMQAGSTFTQPPTGTDVTQLLGWAHFGVPTSGSYFEALGTGPGAIGFTDPLPAGPYTLWIQQTGAQLVSYSWGFTTTPAAAPEPATAGLVLLGAGVLLGRVANRFLGRSE